MLLRAMRYWHIVCCYAVCGTVIGYAATLCAVLSWRMAQSDLSTAQTTLTTGPATTGPPMCLRTAYAMCLRTVYEPMRRCVRYLLRSCYAVCGTELAYAATRCA
eukprot:2939338-Rhodomonas_salina.1